MPAALPGGVSEGQVRTERRGKRRNAADGLSASEVDRRSQFSLISEETKGF